LSLLPVSLLLLLASSLCLVLGPLLRVVGQAQLCPDVVVENDGGGVDNGIDCGLGIIYQGSPSGGLHISARNTEAVSPWSGIGRWATNNVPAYTGGKLIYNIAIDRDSPAKVGFHADYGVTPTRLLRWTIAAEASAVPINYGPISPVPTKIYGIAADRREQRLLAMDDTTNPPRLLSIDYITPANSFNYNGLGAALGWEQGRCRGVCVDNTQNYIYTTCRSNSAGTNSRIYRVNKLFAAGTGTGELWVDGNAGYYFGQCAVDGINRRLYVTTANGAGGSALRVISLTSKATITRSIEQSLGTWSSTWFGNRRTHTH
jgi:hypothetical protein